MYYAVVTHKPVKMITFKFKTKSLKLTSNRKFLELRVEKLHV